MLVVHAYGGDSFFPGLVAGFVGTLFAFVLGLWWERRREQRQLAAAAANVREEQKTEIRRRFAALLPELEENAESVDFLKRNLKPEPMTFKILHPQLLDSAWTANAPRLGQLIADYELVSDLATFYGRIEELRWRIRYRTERRDGAMDAMTLPLVIELRSEVHDLISRVRAQIDAPDVQTSGLLHRGALAAETTLSVSLTTNVVRGAGAARSATAGADE